MRNLKVKRRLGVIWRGLVGFAFRRLYNEFAWAYDTVSRLVSRGEWKNWQRAALPHLKGPRVLELAFGTGDLLLEMAGHYRCYGVDLSPPMAAIAKRKLKRRGLEAPLIRARAEALPFADGIFDSLVSTFPSPFIFQAKARDEMLRVLEPKGHLLVVDEGRLLGGDPWSRTLNWALDVTGGRGGLEYLREGLAAMGMITTIEKRTLTRSEVRVLLAIKEG
jgi:ubiquinone/menaquinone biosynthesis C-methylase UbiE